MIESYAKQRSRGLVAIDFCTVVPVRRNFLNAFRPTRGHRFFIYHDHYYQSRFLCNVVLFSFHFPRFSSPPIDERAISLIVLRLVNKSFLLFFSDFFGSICIEYESR